MYFLLTTMTLKEKIQADFKEAYKTKDEARFKNQDYRKLSIKGGERSPRKIYFEDFTY